MVAEGTTTAVSVPDFDPAGLSTADVKQRIQRGAVNTLSDGPSRTTAEIVRANVVTRFNILLGILLVVILVAVREPRDALFGIVLVTNTAIGIVQELRAKRTLDRLAVLTSPTIGAIRNAKTVTLAVDKIVVDDLLLLKTGDQLPVDGQVVESNGLEIDESLLTGESDSVSKQAGHAVLSGSFVVAGSGSYIAQRVGDRSYAAALAQQAKEFTLVNSELRDGINLILKVVSWTVPAMVALLVWNGRRDTELLRDAPFSEALRSAVAGAVGMIPQGLVLLTSVAFAVGVVRLGRRNVLVQELPAIEGLARVDTVCFDKTGTLTEGKLRLLEVEVLDESRDVDTALAAVAAADRHPNATLQAVATAYPPVPGWTPVRAVPFSSARKWSGADFGADGSWLLGAPDILAPGDAEVRRRAEEGAWRGRRMLLLAHSRQQLRAEEIPGDLTPVAMLSLGDTVRSDAADTLRYFAEQGVQAKVISGDHPETVGAIAREVGVPGSHEVIDARQLPEDPHQLRRIAAEHTVFGRVTPQQKRALLNALQDEGHVVAMTGDGVNDVLALKDADIGIAIGSGSAASRAVSQLVLLDGSFATLPGVVGEGRRVIANIERVANLFVTKTIYAIFIALAVGLAARPFPFLPRHLTLVGSVTIGIPAFFLALAPSTRRARSGFVMRVARFSIPTGIAAGLATFFAYELAINDGVDLATARTTATLVLSAIGLFALGMVSRPLVPWKKGLLWAMAAILLVLFVTSPSRAFFELEIPPAIVLMAAVGIVAITGAIMVGTLRGVGWIRLMPELLRQHPPEPSAWVRRVRQGVRTALDRRSGPTATPADAPQPAPPETSNEATRPVEEPEPADAPDPLDDIQWFDPDAELSRGPDSAL